MDHQTFVSTDLGGALEAAHCSEDRGEVVPSTQPEEPEQSNTGPTAEALPQEIDTRFCGYDASNPVSPISSRRSSFVSDHQPDVRVAPGTTAATDVDQSTDLTASNVAMESGREQQSPPPSDGLEKPKPKADGPLTTDRAGMLMLWLPEIAASLLAVGFLIAIVVVLLVYENQLLAEIHLPRYLSLNGLIAIFATLNRVCLAVPLGSSISQEVWIYLASNETQQRARSSLRDLTLSDAASRGLWGSLVFLFTTPRRYVGHLGRPPSPLTPSRYVTTITVLVSLLSLGISTFVQQLAVYENLPVPQSSAFRAGNIPRSETYDTSAG